MKTKTAPQHLPFVFAAALCLCAVSMLLSALHTPLGGFTAQAAEQQSLEALEQIEDVHTATPQIHAVIDRHVRPVSLSDTSIRLPHHPPTLPPPKFN